MMIENFSEEEIKERFNNFGSKMYNLKYSFELFLNYLETENDASLNTICLGHILKDYFEKAKMNIIQSKKTSDFYYKQY